MCAVAGPISAHAQDATFQWAGAYGGGTYSAAFESVVDSRGNIYTVGAFDGTVDFDRSGAVENRASAGQTDGYILKSDPLGNFIWVVTFGGSGSDEFTACAIDESDSVYALLQFQGTFDVDPGPGSTILSSAGAVDAALVKIDADGDLLLARSSGGTGNDSPLGLAVSNDGSLFFSGTFSSPTIDLDPGAGTSLATLNGARDMWIVKLDRFGAYVWGHAIGGSGDDVGSHVAVDSSGDIWFVTGFQGTVDFDPGAGTSNLTATGQDDMGIAIFDPTGSLITVFQIGGSGRDNSNDVFVDTFGNVYLTGVFESTVDFDPSGSVANLSSNGDRDFFLA